MGGGYYDREVISSSGGGAGNTVVGKTSSLSAGLDPKNKIDEESRITCDNLNPIVFSLDVTGSMGEWPKIIYDKMPMFYGQIKMKNYLPDPAISFCAIGDAYHDQAPLQVTAFGQGKEIDEMIAKLWLEGGGGPGHQESYELSAYFYNHYVKLQGTQMNFFFVTGDESFYEVPEGQKYLKALGEEPKKPVSGKFEWEQLRKHYNVFLLKKQYNSSHEKEIYQQWVAALGGEERILKTKTPKACVDIILGAIALTSGARTLEQYDEDLREKLQTEERITEVNAALEKYSKALTMKTIVPVGKKLGQGLPLPVHEYKVQLKKMAQENAHITESYFCPLTKELFIDPVMTCNGQTFERKAIEEWLKTHNTCPGTEEKLQNKSLVPNLLIQKHILELYKQYTSKNKAKEAAVELEKLKIDKKEEEKAQEKK